MITPMYTWWATQKLEMRLWWRRTSERLLLKLVWALPRSVAYWSAIRVAAHATTGQFGTTDPTRLSVMEMLKRWDIREPGEPRVWRRHALRRHG